MPFEDSLLLFVLHYLKKRDIVRTEWYLSVTTVTKKTSELSTSFNKHSFRKLHLLLAINNSKEMKVYTSFLVVSVRLFKGKSLLSYFELVMCTPVGLCSKNICNMISKFLK